MTLVEGAGGEVLDEGAEVGGVEGEARSGESEAVRDFVSVNRLVACCSMLLRFSSRGSFARSSPTATRRAGRELDELNEADRPEDERLLLESRCCGKENGWFGVGGEVKPVEPGDEGMAGLEVGWKWRLCRFDESCAGSTRIGRMNKIESVAASEVEEESATTTSARRRRPLRVKKSS